MLKIFHFRFLHSFHSVEMTTPESRRLKPSKFSNFRRNTIIYSNLSIFVPD